MIISRSVLLRMRNVSGKSCRENQNTHFVLNNIFPKIVPFVRHWKNTVQPDRPQKKIWRMGIARRIPRTTNTHSEYVILIAFYGKSSFTDVSHCYVIRSFHVVFLLEIVPNES